MTPRQAALYLGLTTSTLARYRVIGAGPRFLRIGRGKRLIRYELAALREWSGPDYGNTGESLHDAR